MPSAITMRQIGMVQQSVVAAAQHNAVVTTTWGPRWPPPGGQLAAIQSTLG
jgi:hypothetical protein